MSIDSEAKRRRAAAAAGLPFIPAPPKPDGVISDADRAILAGVYIIGEGESAISGYRRRHGSAGGHRTSYRSRY